MVSPKPAAHDQPDDSTPPIELSTSEIDTFKDETNEDPPTIETTTATTSSIPTAATTPNEAPDATTPHAGTSSSPPTKPASDDAPGPAAVPPQTPFIYAGSGDSEPLTMHPVYPRVPPAGVPDHPPPAPSAHINDAGQSISFDPDHFLDESVYQTRSSGKPTAHTSLHMIHALLLDIDTGRRNYTKTLHKHLGELVDNVSEVLQLMQAEVVEQITAREKEYRMMIGLKDGSRFAHGAFKILAGFRDMEHREKQKLQGEVEKLKAENEGLGKLVQAWRDVAEMTDQERARVLAEVQQGIKERNEASKQKDEGRDQSYTTKEEGDIKEQEVEVKVKKNHERENKDVKQEEAGGAKAKELAEREGLHTARDGEGPKDAGPDPVQSGVLGKTAGPIDAVAIPAGCGQHGGGRKRAGEIQDKPEPAKKAKKDSE
ncbi:Hypothetical protein D9617_18g032990 [Elsinoe fawcettii]|nr:Hypothetical protein D9617_18g032990 [Elsinoe fawcettii]